MRLPLLGMVGLYDPLAILAITNQFYERAICLHATKQTLNTFCWQAVPNRGPKHLEPPQTSTKSLQALRSETQVVSAGANPVCPLERSALFQKKRIGYGFMEGRSSASSLTLRLPRHREVFQPEASRDVLGLGVAVKGSHNMPCTSVLCA